VSAALAGEGGQRATVHKLVDGVIAPGLEAEADELRALNGPRGAQKKIQAIAAAIDAAAAKARKDPQAFVTDATATLAKAQRLARAYDVNNCAQVT
jgi:hypothetical protein